MIIKMDRRHIKDQITTGYGDVRGNVEKYPIRSKDAPATTFFLNEKLGASRHEPRIRIPQIDLWVICPNKYVSYLSQLS